MQKRKYLVWCLIIVIMASITGCSNSPVAIFKAQKYASLLSEKVDSFEGEETEFELKYESAEQFALGMEVVAENSKYELLYNRKSLVVGVKEKSSGTVFSTNPWNSDNDPLAIGTNEEALKSQIEITYLDNDNTIKTMRSYPDSVKLGQYESTLYKNGISIDYTLGKKSESVWVLPALTVERFEEISSKLEGRDLLKWEMLYNLTSIEDFEDKEREKMIKKYPLLEKQDLYISIELNDYDSRSIDGYLKKAGYTQEDFSNAIKEVGVNTNVKITPVFTLSLEYALTDSGLTVTVPNDSISYDTENFTLLTITLLKYFGADTPSVSGDGYIFVPDGSGALININNQSENRREYISGRIYGNDPAFEQTNTDNLDANMSLPVFGIHRNSGEGLFAVVTEGDENGKITATLGEPNTSYYSVGCEFVYTESDTVTFSFKKAASGTTNYIIVPSDKSVQSNFTIDYSFLTGSDTGYNQMAQIYKNKYFSKKNAGNSKGIELGIGTLGTALYKNSFMGIFNESEAEFTTYAQSRKIVSELRKLIEREVGINLFLKGWQEGGLDTKAANCIRFSDVLGGKSDFAELKEQCATKDIDLFPEIDMFFVSKDTSFDGFSVNSDSAVRLDKKYAGRGRFDPEIGIYDDISPLISPKKYSEFFDGVFSDIKRYGLNGVSLSTTGNVLASDFNTDNVYTRTQTKFELVDLLSKYSKETKIALTGTNAYALKLASVANEIPLSNSGFAGESKSVPFIQLVCSGNTVYHSSAINLDEDKQITLLKCIATGTSPYYLVAAGNIEQLKSTKYTEYYSIDYERIEENIIQEFTFVSEALSCCEGAEMISYEYLSDNVTKTVYDNGVEIYVNTGNDDYFSDGITVESKKYITVSD